MTMFRPIEAAGMPDAEAAANAEIVAPATAPALRLAMASIRLDTLPRAKVFRSTRRKQRRCSKTNVDGVNIEFSDPFHKHLYEIGEAGTATPQAEKRFERMRDFIEPDGVASKTG